MKSCMIPLFRGFWGQGIQKSRYKNDLTFFSPFKVTERWPIGSKKYAIYQNYWKILNMMKSCMIPLFRGFWGQGIQKSRYKNDLTFFSPFKVTERWPIGSKKYAIYQNYWKILNMMKSCMIPLFRGFWGQGIQKSR